MGSGSADARVRLPTATCGTPGASSSEQPPPRRLPPTPSAGDVGWTQSPRDQDPLLLPAAPLPPVNLPVQARARSKQQRHGKPAAPMLPLRAPTPGACLRRAERARGRPPALTPWQRPTDSPPLRGRDGAGPSACPLPGPSAPLPCSLPASPQPCPRSRGVTKGATGRGFAPRPGRPLAGNRVAADGLSPSTLKISPPKGARSDAAAFQPQHFQ